MLPLLMLAALALAPAATLAAEPAPTIERFTTPPDARVFIVSPADGASVDAEFDVEFGVEGMEIRPAGDLTPGSGHHHLLIDVSELPPLDAPIPDDAQHRHFGKGQTSTRIQLAPGTHTLQLDFADGRHVQFDPPLVSPRITVHVRAEPDVAE